jgi:oligopeptide transport system substrate-binding protein
MMKLGLTYHNAFDFQAARRAYREGFSLWQRMADEPRGAAGLPPEGVLRITALEPGSLAPGVALDHPSAIFQEQLFSGLVEVSPDLSIVPDVAQRWQVLDGGRRWVFYLRDNVLWSDGVPVTAHDFEYAWRRALEPSRDWLAIGLLYDLKGAKAYHEGSEDSGGSLGVQATDDRTLVVELEAPTSYFPYLLAFSPLYPVPRHVIERHGPAWTEPGIIVSNGPFRLVDRVPGERIILERNPTYHGRFTGNVRRVECAILSGPSARHMKLYDQDELDICGDLPSTEISHARQRYAEEYVSGPKLSVDFVGFDLSRPPFDDERVRRAFVMGTNRETLAHVSLRGYAFPATGGLIPPGMPGHSPGIGLPYDVRAASELMAEAGYAEGRGFPEIACLARDDPGHDLLCAHLQAEWRENLGVAIEWEEVEWAHFPDRMVRERPHLWMTGWWADYPDPDDYLRVQWWTSPAWRNPSYERLVEEARRVSDQEERLRMYREGDRILVEEAPLLPLTYLRFHCLVKPWVRRYRTSPLKWWFWKDVIVEPH